MWHLIAQFLIKLSPHATCGSPLDDKTLFQPSCVPALAFINYCRGGGRLFVCFVVGTQTNSQVSHFCTSHPCTRLTNWCDNAGVLIFTQHSAQLTAIPFFINLDWKVLSSRYNALRGTGGCVCLRCANSEG